MRVSVKYKHKNSSAISEREFDSIKKAREYAKQFVDSPIIDRVWISRFDTWHWYIKETLKEVK